MIKFISTALLACVMAFGAVRAEDAPRSADWMKQHIEMAKKLCKCDPCTCKKSENGTCKCMMPKDHAKMVAEAKAAGKDMSKFTKANGKESKHAAEARKLCKCKDCKCEKNARGYCKCMLPPSSDRMHAAWVAMANNPRWVKAHIAMAKSLCKCKDCKCEKTPSGYCKCMKGRTFAQMAADAKARTAGRKPSGHSAASLERARKMCKCGDCKCEKNPRGFCKCMMPNDKEHANVFPGAKKAAGHSAASLERARKLCKCGDCKCEKTPRGFCKCMMPNDKEHANVFAKKPAESAKPAKPSAEWVKQHIEKAEALCAVNCKGECRCDKNKHGVCKCMKVAPKPDAKARKCPRNNPPALRKIAAATRAKAAAEQDAAKKAAMIKRAERLEKRAADVEAKMNRPMAL